MTQVYKLRGLINERYFSGFTSPGNFLDVIPRLPRDPIWSIRRVSEAWHPPKLKGVINEGNDYPCVDLIIPAFSYRSVECLRDLLEANGEILPLRSENGRFSAYNVTTLADVLDLNRSELDWTSDRLTVIAVGRYEFQPDLIGELSIFRIPQRPADIYVTERFRERVVQNNLGGFDFQIVWPLPKGTSWSQLAKDASKRRKSP